MSSQQGRLNVWSIFRDEAKLACPYILRTKTWLKLHEAFSMQNGRKMFFAPTFLQTWVNKNIIEQKFKMYYGQEIVFWHVSTKQVCLVFKVNTTTGKCFLVSCKKGLSGLFAFLSSNETFLGWVRRCMPAPTKTYELVNFSRSPAEVLPLQALWRGYEDYGVVHFTALMLPWPAAWSLSFSFGQAGK